MPNDRVDLKLKPRLNVLRKGQIEDVHDAVLEVLERTGVHVNHPKVLEMLDHSDARVDGHQVRIPDWMVKDALRKAPSRVVLGDRNGERSVVLERNRSWFGPSLDCMDFLDPSTSRRRPFRLEDCRTTATLLDALPNYSWGMTFGLASDVSPDLADRFVVKEVLKHTHKPLVFCCKDLNSLKDIYEMAVLIAGGEKQFINAPNIVMLADPISPLVYPDDVLDKMLFCAEKRIPQICYGAPQAGSTSPASFAGTIVQGIAESLSGLVITQLMRQGAPVIFGAFATVMDMRTTIFSYGAPEMSLMSGALAQMAQFYNLPFFGTAGCSDAKLPDSQAAAEATYSCYSSALCGANLIHDCGLLDHGSMASPAYIVLVHEVLHMVKQYICGIDIDDETLAVDIIHRVGPGGHYMNQDHTLKHFRRVWYSNLFDRTAHEQWIQNGETQFNNRLEKQTAIVLEHQPEPLSEGILRELDRMSEHWQ